MTISVMLIGLLIIAFFTIYLVIEFVFVNPNSLNSKSQNKYQNDGELRKKFNELKRKSSLIKI
jgi:hypothetical protein